MEMLFVFYGLLFLQCVQAGEKWETYKNIHSYYGLGNQQSMQKMVRLYYELCPRNPSWCDELFLEENHTLAIIEDEDFVQQLCDPCSCQADCVFHENCCPGSMLGFAKHRFKKMLLNKEPTEIHTEENVDWFYFLQECMEQDVVHFGDNPTMKFDIKNCHNFSDWAPVTSKKTGLSYYNKHCANCNGDRNITWWITTFSCEFPEDATPDEKMAALEEDGKCTLIYFNGDLFKIDEHDWDTIADKWQKRQFSSPNIETYSACNITGLWHDIDREIDLACQMFDTPYMDNTNITSNIPLVNSRHKYHNVYCFVCNPSIVSHYYLTHGHIIDSCLHSNNDERFIKGWANARLYPYKDMECLYSSIMNNSYFLNTNNQSSMFSFEKVTSKTYKYRITLNISKEYFHTFLESGVVSDINATNAVYIIPPYRICHPKDEISRSQCGYEGINYTFDCSPGGHFDPYTSNVTEKRGSILLLKYILCTTRQASERSPSVYKDKCGLQFDYLNIMSVFLLECPLSIVDDKYIEGMLDVTCDQELNKNLVEVDDIPVIVFTYCNVTISHHFLSSEDEDETIPLPCTSESGNKCTCFDFPWYFGKQETCQSGNSLMTYRQMFAANPNFDAKVSRAIGSTSNDCPLDVRPCPVFCDVARVLVEGKCVHKVDSNRFVIQYTLSMWHISDEFDFGKNAILAHDDSNVYNRLCHDMLQNVEQRLTMKGTQFELTECEVKMVCNTSKLLPTKRALLRVLFNVMLISTNTLTHFEDTLVDIVTSNLTNVVEKHRHTVRDDTDCSILDLAIWKAKPQFVNAFIVNVSRYLTCPMISFNNSEYFIDDNDMSVHLTAYNKSFDMSLFKLHNHSLTTCLSTIQTPVNTLTQSPQLDILYKILDSACTTISFLCLVISFIIYCMFKELRNIPGIVNMNLIVCLFLAQAFTKFGLWVTYVPSLCVAFGFLIHYFWLATFFSMSVCAFNVFRIFVLNPMSVPPFSYYILFKYACFIYLAPLLIVAATASVSLVKSSGENIGYGERMCFINDNLLSVITLLIPIAISLVLNTIFFIKTVCTLRASSSNVASPERSYIAVYIKLFIMLGFTWPMLIVDALLDFSVFSYFALVLSSLQGLYIFLSFTCRRQVWRLTCKSRRRQQRSTAYTTSTSL